MADAPSSTNATDSAESLQSIINQTFGTSNAFPVVALSNGGSIPTGTVAALLVNIKAFDAGDEERRKALEPAIRTAIPALRQTGLFDLFKPEEWIAGGGPGRALVGKLEMEEAAKGGHEVLAQQ